VSIWDQQFIRGDKAFRLFLSHTHLFAKVMAALKWELVSYRVVAFVAHEDIEPGREWQDVIEVALSECDALAAYLTEDFHSSAWTDQEVGAVIGRGELVVPIKVGVVPYGFMGRIHAVPGAGVEPKQLASALVRIFETDSRTRQRFAEVVVERFFYSNTFDETRENLKLIEQIDPDLWMPEMAERVGSAAGENDQITKARIGFDEGSPTGADRALALLKSLGFETPSAVR
jgi:TIR domain